MDAFQTQEFYGIVILCLALPFVFRWYAPTGLLIAWAYFLVSTARLADINRLTHAKKTLHIGHSSATALVLWLLVPTLVCLAPRRIRRYFMVALICALFLNLVPLAMTAGYVNIPARGLFDCESFDAGIMAAILPVAVLAFVGNPAGWRDLLLVVLSFLVPLAATLVTHTTTGFYILATVGLGYAGYVRGASRKFVLGCVATVLVLGVYFAANGMTNTSGRWAGWGFFMKWWWDFGSPVTYLVGMGGGTFQYLGTLIQMSRPGMDAFSGGGWLWMHNDWLQVLFEYGLIGLLLAAGVFAWAVHRARREPWIAIGLVAYGVLALAQFPTHWIITQVWATLLLRESLSFDPDGAL